MAQEESISHQERQQEENQQRWKQKDGNWQEIKK